MRIKKLNTSEQGGHKWHKAGRKARQKREPKRKTKQDRTARPCRGLETHKTSYWKDEKDVMTYSPKTTAEEID